MLIRFGYILYINNFNKIYLKTYNANLYLSPASELAYLIS